MWKPRFKVKYRKGRVAIFNGHKSALATNILAGDVYIDNLLSFDSYSRRKSKPISAIIYYWLSKISLIIQRLQAKSLQIIVLMDIAERLGS